MKEGVTCDLMPHKPRNAEGGNIRRGGPRTWWEEHSNQGILTINRVKTYLYLPWRNYNKTLSQILHLTQSITSINLLKPTGYVIHQQFNIQQLYVLPTLYLCVLYLSENKQWLVSLTSQTDWFLQPRRKVFTARYDLSLYIKQSALRL